MKSEQQAERCRIPSGGDAFRAGREFTADGDDSERSKVRVDAVVRPKSVANLSAQAVGWGGRGCARTEVVRLEVKLDLAATVSNGLRMAATRGGIT